MRNNAEIKRPVVAIFAVVFAVAVISGAAAQEKERTPSPLPLHNIEGSGGIVLTPTAYLANPSAGEGVLGYPSASTAFVTFGEKMLSTVAVTETFFERVEIGYAHQYLNIGTLDNDIMAATGIDIKTDHLSQDIFHAKFLLLEEGALDSEWIPALAFEVDYKMNGNIDDIDRKLGGAIRGLGLHHDDGIDYLVIASKTFKGVLPQPFLASVGLRFTQGAQTGLLGFDGAYSTNVEANIGYFLKDWLVVGAEYRQKPDGYRRISGVGGRPLIGREEDWWDVYIGAVINPNLTVKAAYIDLGQVANTREDAGFAFAVKYNF